MQHSERVKEYNITQGSIQYGGMAGMQQQVGPPLFGLVRFYRIFCADSLFLVKTFGKFDCGLLQLCLTFPGVRCDIARATPKRALSFIFPCGCANESFVACIAEQGMVAVYPPGQAIPRRQTPAVMRQQSAPGPLTMPMNQPISRSGSITPGPGKLE